MKKEAKTPSPYYGEKSDPYECIKVLQAWGLDKCFYLGNVTKYIKRAGKKPGNTELRDLKAARDYLTMKINKIEKEENR